MKRVKKGLAISMALAVLLTSSIVTSVMASEEKVSSLSIISRNDGIKDKNTGNGQAKQEEVLNEKQKREEIKAIIKATYTNDELKKIEEVGKTIQQKNKDIAVLPVENIIIKGVNAKFDTPPVIKSGRTLIPVKALSEAFGATVQWIGEERKVIITKGDIEIILKLDSNKIYVNGVESTIDVPATSINSRTVVPLSFIVQKLGLKVNWHGDSRDIEIEDPTNPTPPGNTTGSAIEIPTGSAIEVN